MTGKNKYKIIQWGAVLIIGLFSIALLYLNVLTPLMPGDDYLYSLKIPEHHYLGNKPIQSIQDYLESQVNHFKNYNYRVIPHAVLQLLLLMPSWIFDVLNTGVFLLLPLVILKGNNISRKLKPVWYLVVLLCLWIFHFDLGRSYFWTTGALNYSWTLIPQLLYIHILLRYTKTKETKQSRLLLPIALLIAMTNEQVVLSLFLVTFWILFVKYLDDKKLPPSLLAASFILLSGGLIMYFSPAMSFRLERDGFAYESDYYRWIEYFRRVIYYSIRYLPLVALPLLVGFNQKRMGIRFKYLIVIVLLSMIAMSQAPLFEPRSAVFGFTVFFMAIVRITDLNKMNYYLFGVLVFVSILLFVERVPLFKQVAEKHRSNTLILEEHRGSPDTVFLDRFCNSYKYQCLICDDITDDPTYMDNEPVAAFYGIDKLALKPSASLKYQSEKTRTDFVLNDIQKYEKAKLSASKMTEEVKLKECYFTNKELLNLAIALESNVDLSDHIVILRGARKGINRYRLYDVIPPQWRLYFLDYLEYDVAMSEINGSYMSFQTVFEPELYQYYLISLYNLNNHAPVGNTIKVEITLPDNS